MIKYIKSYILIYSVYFLFRQDVEGDDVVISSDDELMEALVEHSIRRSSDEVQLPFKFQVKLSNNGGTENNGRGT